MQQEPNGLERLALRATKGIGSPASIIIHTILFVGMFGLHFLKIDFDKILLVLTTIVSLEAIYLAIFIQMSLNLNTARLSEVSEDVEEISMDVGEIQENIGEIQDNVEDIQVDVGELEEGVKEISEDVEKA